MRNLEWMQRTMVARFGRAGAIVLTLLALAAADALTAQHVHAQAAEADAAGAVSDVITHARHPVPRAGVTAENVLPPERLAGEPDVARIYDMARQIPEIIDGIYCWCGCHERMGHRSLLTCYEGSGMAMDCSICQGEAELAYKLHQEGATLDDIRAVIDAEFGS